MLKRVQHDGLVGGEHQPHRTGHACQKAAKYLL